MKDGVFDGRGTLAGLDGSNYSGEFKGGKKHGKGVLVYNQDAFNNLMKQPSSFRYEGAWEND